MAEQMRTDEGKTGTELGVKSNMKRATPKVGPKKDEIAGRMKAKGMPYTMSSQDGSFERGRGQEAKMWGPNHDFARGGGMPYRMWGPSDKVTASKRSMGKTAPIKNEK